MIVVQMLGNGTARQDEGCAKSCAAIQQVPAWNALFPKAGTGTNGVVHASPKISDKISDKIGEIPLPRRNAWAP